MAARIRLLQLAIAVVNIIIVGLVFTSIWPFVNGDVRVDLPSASEVEWTYDGGVVHVTAPFSISNDGFWDIDDLTVRYEVTNDSKAPLVNGTIEIGSIKVGDLVSSRLDFEFDLLRLYNQGVTWMVFNDDMLNFFVEVSCGYTMKMVKFDATYQVSVPWDALIRSWDVNNETSWSPPTPPPSEYSVHYWLNTSSILRVVPPATLSIQLYGLDAGGNRVNPPLEEISREIQLGGDYDGTITLHPSLALYPAYEIVYSVQVADFPPQQDSFRLGVIT